MKLFNSGKTKNIIFSFYLIVTLPLAILFFYSEYYRFQTFQQINFKISHFTNPKYVFIGNSITSGLRNYWYKFDLTPLFSINLAANGFTTRQINFLIDKATQLNPQYIFVMAGTNDLFDNRLSNQEIIEDWEILFEKLKKQTSSKIIITGIPIQADVRLDQRILYLNNSIKNMTEKSGYVFIDINKIITSDIKKSGNNRDEYFIDSVHFSDKSYQLWTKELAKIVNLKITK